MCPALAAVGTGEPSSYVQQQVREFLSGGSITNYVTLVGQSLRISHDERYLKWRKWSDPDRIIADIRERIDQFPFTRHQIEMVIRRVFGSATRADGSDWLS